MLNSHRVLLLFEISEPERVLELSVISLKLTRLLKSFHSLVVKLHFEESNPQEVKSQGAQSTSAIKLINSFLLQLLPCFFDNQRTNFLFELAFVIFLKRCYLRFLSKFHFVDRSVTLIRLRFSAAASFAIRPLVLFVSVRKQISGTPRF